jgi:hypothetical protein
MQSEERNQAVIIIVLVASLGVASSVVSLGMGFVNIMSADAAGPLSVFGLANKKPDLNSRAAIAPSAPSLAGRFVDVNYLREEITAREDQIATLRPEVELDSKKLDILHRLKEKLDLTEKPDASEVDGVPLEAQAITREINKTQAEIARLRQRQEEAAQVHVDRWLAGIKSTEKPQWVECNKDAVLLQPQSAHFAQNDLEPTNSSFVMALNSRSAILLIRPSGFDICSAVRKILDAHQIVYDLVPIDESWQLVFR